MGTTCAEVCGIAHCRAATTGSNTTKTKAARVINNYNRALEVADFLEEFAMIGTPECASWVEFKVRFDWDTRSLDVQQAAANTFYEWFHEPSGRQLSKQYRRS